MIGLAAQSHAPDEVLVVARPDDAPTHAAVADAAPQHLNCRIVPVYEPGLVAARNAGLGACQSDVIAFCDDDTVADSDWIRRILMHFREDAALGGLGGRDNCHDGERFQEGQRRVVGRLQWFGRAVGNHHLGYGPAREVHFLKGANMSYRREALAGRQFDVRLRGKGGQPHDDLAFSLAVNYAGWKLVYDPAVAVDHYAASYSKPRTYVATEAVTDPHAYMDSMFNLVLALWDVMRPAQRIVFALWSLLVGIRTYPGLLQVVRLLPNHGFMVVRKFLLCQRASFAAYTFLLLPPRDRRLTAVGAGEGAG